MYQLKYLIFAILFSTACISNLSLNTSEPMASPTINSIATLQFESTAIARFTEQPDYRASLTPFYGHILFNEAFRQITETPVFDAERECYLVADFWKMRDLEDDIQFQLLEIYESISVTAFVRAVWNSETCNEYLPTANSINIWIGDDDEDTQLSIEASTVKITLDIIIDSLSSRSDISSDLSSILIFISSETSQRINTNLLKVNQALSNERTGDELIEALGGWITPLP